MSNKYIPPHLRGAAAAGGAAAPAATAAATTATRAPATIEGAAAIVNSLLRARTAEEGGQQQQQQQQQQPDGAAGGPQQGEAKGAWGSWGRGAPNLRTTKQHQQRSAALRVVEVDSLVLMKIIKHWRDFHPVPVNGQLLGTEVRDKLEVTNCFPLPQKKEVLAALQQEKVIGDLEERVDEEFDRYQDRMAELMHDLNVDCFTVGWYMTVSTPQVYHKETLESLVAYQEVVDRAVLLAFDPNKLREGKAPLKAFRVRPEFLSHFHSYESDVTQYAKINPSQILVEVPVSLRSAFLLEASFSEWFGASADSCLSPSWGETKGDTLRRSLLSVSSCLEVLGEEQDKLQRYQRESLRQQQLQKQLLERRRLENDQRRLRGEPLLPQEPEGLGLRPVEPPSLLPSMLLGQQANQHVKEICSACSDSIGDMFLLNNAAKSKKETSE